MPRRLAVSVASALLFVSAACGASVTLPTATCAPELAIGTPCVPADSAYVRAAFEGVSTPDQVAPLLSDGRFAGTLKCAEDPGDSMICSVGSGGATIVVPVDMPEGRQIQFSGGELAAPITIDLAEGEPVGVRYSGRAIRVDVVDEEAQYYGFVTVEPVVVDSAGSEDATESDDGADSE